MAKGADKQKKAAKKPAQQSLKEKRAAKHAKEAEKNRGSSAGGLG